VKNAQEAHEAIRPAGESFRTPAQTGLRGDEFRLYELIWMRTIASQMADAKLQRVTVQIDARPAAESGQPSCGFTSTGSTARRTLGGTGWIRTGRQPTSKRWRSASRSSA